MFKQQYYTTLRRKPDIGTFNPKALNQPLFQKHLTRKSTYDELANLSNQAETLRVQNQQLKEKMEKYIQENAENPFCQYKKYQVDLSKKIAEREKELKDFAEHFEKFRTSTDPTFVEVDASSVRMPSYDPITVSLLISNEQKKFFLSKDIKEQNEALKALIAKQQDSLNLLNGRLKVFNQMQAENSIKMAIRSLMNGELPSRLAEIIPTQYIELKTQHKLLSDNLAVLTKKRREAQKVFINKKLRNREKRLCNRSATKIQRIYRGFRVRNALRNQKKCALLIQRIVRRFLARLHFKKILRQREEEEEEEDNIESIVRMRQKRVRVTFETPKRRIIRKK